MRSLARKSGRNSPDVGCDHADQRHQRQVKPLGDHLRADQHVRLVGDELGEDRIVAALRAGHIAIPAQRARLREFRLDRLLHVLGAAAEVADALALAIGTEGRHRIAPVAVMADERLPGAVIGERCGAPRARFHMTAVAAHDERRGAAPVEIEDRLLARGEHVSQPARQRPAEHAAVARAQLLAHVHDVDLGEIGGLLDETTKDR